MRAMRAMRAMSKKLFVVSDVHGHYSQLVQALEEAEFDRDCGDHTLVSCGDLFDRGRENGQMYDFVRNLPHKILIRGNHEDMLYRVLDRGYVTETENLNGTDITLTQLLGEDALDPYGSLNREAYASKIRELMEFIDAMDDYYEEGPFVFLHGWAPITFQGNRPLVSHAWRKASVEEWRIARLLEWQQLYSVGAVMEGKTIVCGHRPARFGYAYDQNREPDCDEPFRGKGIIAIDPYVVRSGRVCVLVLGEEELQAFPQKNDFFVEQ